MLPDPAWLGFIYAGSAVILLYVLVILILRRGFLSLVRDQSNRVPHVEDAEKVTVIVPFRNESDHLPNLISDLKAQSCPPGSYKVLLVDDHSEDSSLQLVREAIGGDPRFEVKELGDNQAGKKAAIALAVGEVQTRWILQTDADCRMGPGFLSGHLSFLRDSSWDLVAGVVTTGERKGTFSESLDRLELLSLAGSGAGSFRLGRPVLCSGANLLYTRELYLESRAFDPEFTERSGDDMFLMIGARKLGKRLEYCLDPDTLVFTQPVPGIRSLVAQRVRWGSKSVSYRMADIQLLALIVALTNLLVLLLPLSMIISFAGWPFIAGIIFLKLLADYLMVSAVSRLTGQRKSLRWFVPVTVLYHLLQPVIYVRLFFSRAAWKGRK